MLKTLEAWDRAGLIWLNNIHHPYADTFFYFITHTLPWVPLFAFLIYAIVIKYGWKSLWILLGAALVVTCADQFTSSFMKPFFGRLRPCWEPELQQLLHIPHGCGGRFGFASSHAADTFSAASFLFIFLRPHYKYSGWVFLWPALSSYSRIYLAAHYPGDVLVGAVVGFLLAVLFAQLVQRFATRFSNQKA